MATLACQEGQTVNGKEGVDKKKLFCKCNKKSGKCKWKNEANKKVSKDSFLIWKFFIEKFSKSNEKIAPNMKSPKRPNIKNGNALVMLLKSPTKKNQPMEETLAVALRSFLQQMAVHVFLPFMAVVAMELDSQWTEV